MKTILYILFSPSLFLVISCSSSYVVSYLYEDPSVGEFNNFVQGQKAEIILKDTIVNNATNVCLSAVDANGQTVTTSSPSYLQNFPTFEVCMIGTDGSLLFRAVSEGRKTGFWNTFWDSIFQSESDETYYDRVQDSMDGICEVLKD